MLRTFFDLPQRPIKPRETGITMLIDKGASLGAVEHMLEVGSEFVDYVKLAWGSPVILPNLHKKIALYQQYEIPVCLGGVLFELTLLQNKLPEVMQYCQDIGITMVEISVGCIEMEQAQKLDYIRQLKEKFCVLFECGSPDPQNTQEPIEWALEMKTALEAGAWKVIAEGRSSGTVGIYHSNTEPRIEIIHEIVAHISIDDVIWEAPLKKQQTWFIKTFDTNVNLGNVTFEQVIALEALRLGLRSDTFNHIHQHFFHRS